MIRSLRMTACVAALLIPLAPAVSAHADQFMGSMPVQDVIVTSNIPDLALTVRNVSQSTDPADRDLRIVSASQDFTINGQVWCQNALSVQAHAVEARAVFADVTVSSGELLEFGWNGASPVRSFSGGYALENFSLAITYAPPAGLDDEHLVNLNFNPVRVIEDRLEQYVANGVGSPADFLRVSDVFETVQPLGVIGMCRWSKYDQGREYAGVRKFAVPLRIFYQGDPDIRDDITAVGAPGSVQAQQPSRARTGATARGSQSRPPARSTPQRAPRREPQD